MEFRFIVPIIPVGTIYLLWVANSFRAGVRTFLCLFLALWLPYGSIRHAYGFKGAPTGIESIESLRSHLTDLRWDEIGRMLKREFGSADVIVAALPLGIISYLSGLTTIDMLGITDRYIARETEADPVARFAHQRTPPVPYLKQRKVNLIIGEPWFVSGEELAVLPANKTRILHFLYHGVNKKIADPENVAREFPDGFKLLAVPMSDRGDFLVCLYLTEHPLIERLIKENSWQVFRVYSCVLEGLCTGERLE